MKLIKIDDNRFVNLEKVANINFLRDKIVFNMAYSIEKEHSGRISDYFYIDRVNGEGILKDDYFYENFVYVQGKDRNVAINKNYVSYIKRDHRTCKITIGFCHDVTMRDLENIKTVAEHFYIKMESKEELDLKFDVLMMELGN